VKCYIYQWTRDNIPRSDKDKLIKVALELITDANLKLRTISEIRDEHTGFKAFDVGIVLGQQCSILR
jgi:hypothetical protein